MKVTDIYTQYFAAECEFAGAVRKGAAVKLTAESDAGQIRYSVSVSFFLHEDAEDFRISGDAYAERELFSGKGRRSKKREQTCLAALRAEADAAAQSLGGEIHWDAPLIEARFA